MRNLVFVRVMEPKREDELRAGGMGGSPSFFSKLSAIIRKARRPMIILWGGGRRRREKEGGEGGREGGRDGGRREESIVIISLHVHVQVKIWTKHSKTIEHKLDNVWYDNQ